jgi:2-oxoglutarate ferredoxin oxidoreductase subunit gamma
MNSLYEEILIAGFGGQGIIMAGKLLAQAAMKSGKEVTYMPSYGAEVRGGTANCMVVISNKMIASPLITRPNSLIAMNKASLSKFAPRIKDNGLLILNSSLAQLEEGLDNTIRVVKVPADKLAHELGNVKVANMIALGAYVQISKIFDINTLQDCLTDVLAKHYHNTLSINKEAISKGAEFVDGLKM